MFAVFFGHVASLPVTLILYAFFAFLNSLVRILLWKDPSQVVGTSWGITLLHNIMCTILLFVFLSGNRTVHGQARSTLLNIALAVPMFWITTFVQLLCLCMEWILTFTSVSLSSMQTQTTPFLVHLFWTAWFFIQGLYATIVFHPFGKKAVEAARVTHQEVKQEQKCMLSQSLCTLVVSMLLAFLHLVTTVWVWIPLYDSYVLLITYNTVMGTLIFVAHTAYPSHSIPIQEGG